MNHQTRSAVARLLLAAAVPCALVPALSVAAVPAGSAYRTDPQSSHVQDQTSEDIQNVNMITCIMSAVRGDALVNQGDYVALIDKNKCDAKAAASGAQGTDYMTAVVNSSRASNTDPMRVKLWISNEEEGRKMTIFANLSATSAPTASNPYGVFRVDYCGKPASGGACMFNGYLDSSDAGIVYYELSQQPNWSQTIALALTASGTTSGSGRIQSVQNGSSSDFAFSYDPTLFRRSDGTNDQCFSRDATDPGTGFSVWRYGLYDVATGARVDRNSGFPIQFTANGTTYQGFLGYYGLSLPSAASAALTNGATVDKVDYSNGSATRTSYTIVKSAGKLTKYTKQTTTLNRLDHIPINTWFGMDVQQSPPFAGAQPNSQYTVYWDDAAGTFKVSGQTICDSSGCNTVTMSPEPSVPASYWAARGGLNGNSQSLGGEVFVALAGVQTVDSTTVNVVYRTQDLVYPSDLPAQLYCVNNCPTAATLASYFAPGSADASPYVAQTFNSWSPVQPSGVVTYTGSAGTATIQDGTGADVTFADATAMQSKPMYSNGVRTGRLFVNLADAECSPGSNTYCDWQVGTANVYYVWETGPNNWNQFAAAKDATGAFVKFDPPLSLAYTVPSGAQYGEYAGKSLVLQYAGFGNLWGIPGRCFSQVDNSPVSCNVQGARYVAAFAIPFDETTGVATASDGTQYLVKWLDREIRFAAKDPSVCVADNLALPTSNVTLPTNAGLQDPSDPASPISIGTPPTVTSAPRVIQGDVKY
jgi:hypothetical protein